MPTHNTATDTYYHTPNAYHTTPHPLHAYRFPFVCKCADDHTHSLPCASSCVVAATYDPTTCIRRLHQPCNAVLLAPCTPSYAPDRSHVAPRVAKPRYDGCGSCSRCAVNAEYGFYCGVSNVPRVKPVWTCGEAFEPMMQPF